MQMTPDLPLLKATNDSRRPGRLLLTGMALILALKLVLACALDLYSDEIFYWQASTKPALAYSDLPFMAALLAGTGTALLGDTALGVRALFLAMGTSIPLLVYWIARPLMPARQALEAAGLALCMPLCAFLGLLAVPDVPLLFFGLLMTGYLERATRLGTLPYWRHWVSALITASLPCCLAPSCTCWHSENCAGTGVNPGYGSQRSFC